MIYGGHIITWISDAITDRATEFGVDTVM